MPKPIEKLISFFDMDDMNMFAQPRINIVDDIDAETLVEIGTAVYDEYDIDLRSRSDWETKYTDMFELAEQVSREKRIGDVTVSNVKYPILSTASISFSSRSYPNIVKGSDVVKHQVIGSDVDGSKAARGERVSQHMNFQILEQMNSWEDEIDQLLIYLALVGTAFKKTYFDPIERINVSEFVSAQDLVVNYAAVSLDKARRVTHVIELYPNQIIERMRSKVFADMDLEKLRPSRKDPDKTQDESDPDLPHTFLEQHRWWDLDGDGYKEPYIITIHFESKTVARITPRFDITGIEVGAEGEIIRIVPVQYFTQFTFLPAFDGSFYKMGFGSLLYAPINIINTIFNQLIDAGSLANRQGGFLGPGIKLRAGGGHGSVTFQQGEWKQIQFFGDDIRRQIFALPVKEPSNVLFQLLGLMMDATKELASQADILTGEHPKGNVPATTTLALIEQGLKVFSAIYKRVYRSLKLEFKKIRRLNYLNLSDDEYNNIIDYTETVQDPETGQMLAQRLAAYVEEDYGDQWMDIIPVSGAADVSDTQRIIKAQALLELRGQGFNDEAINRRYLEALQIPDINELLPPEGATPPPDPKIVIEERKLELKAMEIQIDAMRQQAEEREKSGKIMQYWANSIKLLADADGVDAKKEIDFYKAEVQRIAASQQMYSNIIGHITKAQIAGDKAREQKQKEKKSKEAK